VCNARHALQQRGDQGHGETPQLTGRLQTRDDQSSTDYEQTQHTDPSQPQQPTRRHAPFSCIDSSTLVLSTVVNYCDFAGCHLTSNSQDS